MYQWLKVCGEWKLGFPSGELITGGFPEVAEFGPHVYPPREDYERVVLPAVVVLPPLPKEEILLGNPVIYETWTEIHSQRQSDCGVVCIANLLQITYKQARMIAFQHGWCEASGIEEGWIQHIMKKHGFIPCFRPSLQWQLPNGVFSVHSPKHVMPAINGTVMNRGSANQVKEVWEYRK